MNAKRSSYDLFETLKILLGVLIVAILFLSALSHFGLKTTLLGTLGAVGLGLGLAIVGVVLFISLFLLILLWDRVSRGWKDIDSHPRPERSRD